MLRIKEKYMTWQPVFHYGRFVPCEQPAYYLTMGLIKIHTVKPEYTYWGKDHYFGFMFTVHFRRPSKDLDRVYRAFTNLWYSIKRMFWFHKGG